MDSLISVVPNLYIYVQYTRCFILPDKPGAPGAPEVDEVGGDFVNLSWEKANDGGGRLLGYIIEKRDAAADRWTRVNYQPIKTLSYNVINLIEDNTYYFRVIAVNLAGESKPSIESSKIVVKDPKGNFYMFVGQGNIVTTFCLLKRFSYLYFIQLRGFLLQLHLFLCLSHSYQMLRLFKERR